MQTEISATPELLYQGQILPSARALFFGRLVEENHEDFLAEGCYMEDHWPSGFNLFNWLKTSLADEVVPGIAVALEELGFSRDFKVACWANIYRKGEWMESHKHGNDEDPNHFLCGTLCLSTVDGFSGIALGLDGPGSPWTWVPDVAGQLILYNSSLIHGTKPNPGPRHRVSINFDIFPKGTEAYRLLEVDGTRVLHFPAFTSVYSQVGYDLLDSERPPCRPPIYQ